MGILAKNYFKFETPLVTLWFFFRFLQGTCLLQGKLGRHSWNVKGESRGCHTYESNNNANEMVSLKYKKFP